MESFWWVRRVESNPRRGFSRSGSAEDQEAARAAPAPRPSPRRLPPRRRPAPRGRTRASARRRPARPRTPPRTLPSGRFRTQPATPCFLASCLRRQAERHALDTAGEETPLPHHRVQRTLSAPDAHPQAASAMRSVCSGYALHRGASSPSSRWSSHAARGGVELEIADLGQQARQAPLDRAQLLRNPR